MPSSHRLKNIVVIFLALAAASLLAANALAIGWQQAARKTGDWFQTDEGKQVVENVLVYQLPCGGWDKNIDIAARLSDSTKEKLAARKNPGTIDNGATYTQLQFLARAYEANHDDRVRDAFNKGVDYLLDAQYDNGGWPMYFPHRKGYYTHIHFNDNSVAGVLRLLRDVADGKPPYEFAEVSRRERAAAAFSKGVDCILKSQVVVDGKKTVWCAQHDEETLKPAPARNFEPVSLSGQESVGLVEILMSVDNPSPEIIDAVRAAVTWFEATKIEGIRVVSVQTDQGRDRATKEDPDAPPIWARFYELGTNKPIFIGRDTVIRFNYSEIERERRLGYAYYGDWPAKLINKEYPAWAAKWHVSDGG